MEERASEARLRFLRSSAGPAYSRKLDPALKDHGVSFDRKRVRA